MQTDKPGSLKNKFEDFGAAPTDQLWHSIETSLDKDTRKKRGFFWWWLGGMAAGLLLIFSVYRLGYHAGKTETDSFQNEVADSDLNHQDTEIIVADPVTPEIEKSETLTPGGETTSNQNSSSIAEHPVNQQTRVNADQPRDDNETDEFVPADPGTGNTDYLAEQKIKTILQPELSEVKMVRLPDTDMPLLISSVESVFDLPTETIQKRKPANKWELGLSAGTLLGYQSSHQLLTVVSSGQSSLSTADNLNFAIENSIQGSGDPTVSYIPDSSQIDASIRRPLGIEFTIARTIGERWSLGSGIGLNYFMAQNNYTTPAEMEVRGHFLSISVPVMADFDVIKRRRFDASVGMGAVNEFPFRISSQTVSFGAPTAQETSQKFIDGYMGSVLLRTGFSYRLNERFKVGISPSLRYYFYQSLQSDIPVLKRNLWGGVSIGCTWNF